VRALGYVKATRNWKLTLGQEIKGLEGFTDASWADEKPQKIKPRGLLQFGIQSNELEGNKVTRCGSAHPVKHNYMQEPSSIRLTLAQGALGFRV